MEILPKLALRALAFGFVALILILPGAYAAACKSSADCPDGYSCTGAEAIIANCPAGKSCYGCEKQATSAKWKPAAKTACPTYSSLKDCLSSCTPETNACAAYIGSCDYYCKSSFSEEDAPEPETPAARGMDYAPSADSCAGKCQAGLVDCISACATGSEDCEMRCADNTQSSESLKACVSTCQGERDMTSCQNNCVKGAQGCASKCAMSGEGQTLKPIDEKKPQKKKNTTPPKIIAEISPKTLDITQTLHPEVSIRLRYENGTPAAGAKVSASFNDGQNTGLFFGKWGKMGRTEFADGDGVVKIKLSNMPLPGQIPHKLMENFPLDIEVDIEASMHDSQNDWETSASTGMKFSLRDGDGDSIYDYIDLCPTRAGTKENFGCPQGTPKPGTVLFRAGGLTMGPVKWGHAAYFAGDHVVRNWAINKNDGLLVQRKQDDGSFKEVELKMGERIEQGDIVKDCVIEAMGSTNGINGIAYNNLNNFKAAAKSYRKMQGGEMTEYEEVAPQEREWEQVEKEIAFMEESVQETKQGRLKYGLRGKGLDLEDGVYRPNCAKIVNDAIGTFSGVGGPIPKSVQRKYTFTTPDMLYAYMTGKTYEKKCYVFNIFSPLNFVAEKGGAKTTNTTLGIPGSEYITWEDSSKTLILPAEYADARISLAAYADGEFSVSIIDNTGSEAKLVNYSAMQAKKGAEYILDTSAGILNTKISAGSDSRAPSTPIEIDTASDERYPDYGIEDYAGLSANGEPLLDITEDIRLHKYGCASDEYCSQNGYGSSCVGQMCSGTPGATADSGSNRQGSAANAAGGDGNLKGITTTQIPCLGAFLAFFVAAAAIAARN